MKIKKIGKKNKNPPNENQFGLTDLVQREKEENEIKLGSFFKLAEENRIFYNHTPANTPIEDMEKIRKGFFTNGVFILVDEGRIETKRFFGNSNDLAEFKDKIFHRYDAHPSTFIKVILTIKKNSNE